MNQKHSVMIRKPNHLVQQLKRSRSSGILPLLRPKSVPEASEINKNVKLALTEQINNGSKIGPVAHYYFNAQGKAFRPRLIMAVAEAVNNHLEIQDNDELEKRQYEIAVISEMYHTASLYHDDVIDKAELRRSEPSVNLKYGSKMSILAGNYVIATSNVLLGRLRDPEVVSIMSRTLQDLVLGELQQIQSSKTEDKFDLYLRKTYNKTASLMANSCQAVAKMASPKGNISKEAYLYGKNLGIAFQLMDDYLDFSASAAILGKPAAADLKLGLATAPVLFAADQFGELNQLIQRRFCEKNDVEKAFNFVLKSDGMEQTKFLAQSYGEAALQAIKTWKDSDAKTELTHLLHDAIQRAA